MASYKAKIARLTLLLDAQAQVIQEYALALAELENHMHQSTPDLHNVNADKFFESSTAQVSIYEKLARVVELQRYSVEFGGGLGQQTFTAEQLRQRCQAVVSGIADLIRHQEDIPS